jgi:hypothetical protein
LKDKYSDTVVETILIEGGPGSGHSGHKGRPGEVGGSATGVGTRFSSILNAKPSKTKLQGLYDSDPEFKNVVDAGVLYSQGGYNGIRDMGRQIITGEFRDKEEVTINGSKPGKDSSVSDARHKLVRLKPMFAGQDIENNKSSLKEATLNLHNAVNASQPMEMPLYRGLPSGWEGEMPKAGDSVELLGLSSFTTDKSIAEGFATAKISGATKTFSAGKNQVLVEVEPGVRGLDISSLSRYRQKEILTNGKFLVLDSKTERIFVGKGKSILKSHLKLKQVGLFEVPQIEKEVKEAAKRYVEPAIKDESEFVKQIFTDFLFDFISQTDTFTETFKKAAEGREQCPSM